jgi:hypothetical protein
MPVQKFAICAVTASSMGAILPLIVSYVVSNMFLHPPLQEYIDLNHPGHFGLNFEEIEFPSLGNDPKTQTLRGWWIEGPKDGSHHCSRTVVAVHGLGMNRREYLRHAQMWHNSGYNVLLFDCREAVGGTSDSFGYGFSYGIREHEDVLSAVHYARNEKQSSKVILIGMSMGAASVLTAVGINNTNVDLVIAENGFSAPEDIWMYHIERAVKGTRAGLQSLDKGVWSHIQTFVTPFLTPRWMTNLILRITRMRIEGMFKRTPPPKETISGVNKPILFIVGTHDPTVPSIHSKNLFGIAKHPKYLWEIPSESHLQGFDLYGAKEFHQKFDEFVNRHLPCSAR